MTKKTEEQKQLERDARGGARKGAGRPRGIFKKKIKTIIQEKVEEELKQKMFKVANELLEAQIVNARGNLLLYMVKYVKGQKTTPILITDPKTISDYIEGTLEEKKGKLEYYHITTRLPDNKAIDSILNRAFGKAAQSVSLDAGKDKDGKPISPISITVVNFGDKKQHPK